MTFANLKPNQRVRFRTPQGQVFTARVNPLLMFATHVVAQTSRGRPVVINERNIVRGKA